MTFELSIDIILYEPYSQHDHEKKKRKKALLLPLNKWGK